jgi:hypothetical protein
LVNAKLEDKIFHNCHFFVNSVKFIKGVLKSTNINPNDVRIVCADNDENKRKLQGYTIGKPSGAACKVNFYTSTCFEGCDIFDPEGKTYVVSEGRNPNTLYDISTLFMQIIGRIRDSNYKDEVIHIVSKSHYDGDVSYEDFKAIVEKECDISEKIVETYNSEDIHLRKQRLNE